MGKVQTIGGQGRRSDYKQRALGHTVSVALFKSLSAGSGYEADICGVSPSACNIGSLGCQSKVKTTMNVCSTTLLVGSFFY
jgi:hypothetical protein